MPTLAPACTTRALALATLAALAAPAFGQAVPAWPTRVVRTIVPFVAGGPTDVQARWAAQQLNTAFGQPFVVENRGGAGGVPGTEAMVKAAPDGYTLLAGNPGPLTIAPSVIAKLHYDPLRDLAPIMLIAKSASCLCTHPSMPVKGVKDFVALAKSQPGRINYASPGVGTVGHLGIALFATEAGIDINHVPYKGAIIGCHKGVLYGPCSGKQYKDQPHVRRHVPDHPVYARAVPRCQPPLPGPLDEAPSLSNAPCRSSQAFG